MELLLLIFAFLGFAALFIFRKNKVVFCAIGAAVFAALIFQLDFHAPEAITEIVKIVIVMVG